MKKLLRRKVKYALALGILLLQWSFQDPAKAQITFDFNFTDAAGTGFNDPTYGAERQSSLEQAATMLSAYFVTTAPVTITYAVSSYSDTSNTLASASSNLISNADGFFPTVIQDKIITGVDTNGAAADGRITYNFGQPWGYGNTVPANTFDFVSTAMHEILHSFGFLSTIQPSDAQTGDPGAWSIFDEYLTDSSGDDLIDQSTFSYNTSLASALTGNPGMFFSGSDAVAAYDGSLVPIFSPGTWAGGSSGSHLDDTTFTGSSANPLDAKQLMNAQDDFTSYSAEGLGIRSLSGIETGILTDLGYQVVPEPQTWALLAAAVPAGVILVMRRRRARCGD